MKRSIRIILKILIVIAIIIVVITLYGCSKSGEVLKSDGGNKNFNVIFYSDDGTENMRLVGSDISISDHTKSTGAIYDNEGIKNKTESSDIISIEIDGKSIKSCGSTIVFEDTNNTPDITYNKNKDDPKKYDYDKNYLVSIQTQDGVPILVYTCNECSYKELSVIDTVKITMDNNLLYLHKANFQIVPMSILK